MTSAQNAAIAALDTAIANAEAVSDSGDGNYHRTLVARCAGVLAAVEALEPNWTGYAAAIDDTIAWSNSHPPH